MVPAVLHFYMSSGQHLPAARSPREPALAGPHSAFPVLTFSAASFRRVASAEHSSSGRLPVCTPESISSDSQISNFKSEISRRSALASAASGAHSSANLGESQRLCVIFFLPVPSPASCNSQLQLHKFLGSVDSRGFRSKLTPFRINTSKLSELLIMGDLCRT